MQHLSPQIAALAGALVGALVFAAFVLAVGGALLRMRARRLAEAARRSLGEPRGALEELGEESGRVTLTGTLETLGSGCARFEDGASVAVATVAGEFATPGNPPALTVRAERLRLKMRDGIVEIRGPVEILGGAQESRPGGGYEALRPQARRRLREAAEGGPVPAGDLEMRSLREGDRVRAMGVLSRVDDAGGASGYRDPAARFELVASKDAAVILAFEGEPRASGPFVAVLAGVRELRGLAMNAAQVLAFGAACGFAVSLWWSKAPASAPAPDGTITRCGQGRCVERPPTLPADWVRHDFAEQWTFFAAPEVKTHAWQPDCGFAQLLEVWSNDFKMHLDFDVRSEEGAAGPAAGFGEEIRMGELVARVSRREIAPADRKQHPDFTQGFGVYIADTGPCPSACVPSSNLPGRLIIGGTCRDRAACDEALRIVQSLRPF
ncbi:hypothetical protein [Polyangium aurulentum]|uniref:hypothetical protein n=1 Tax=Polyangium aurulentum TaxID=2567896 RepID=UPI0010AE9788|nr:hypothetical protein [Polyangium aurulentum]UQA57207.1 hypothetical protein E8A73_038865 [Polyangium aurulentum]